MTPEQLSKMSDEEIDKAVAERMAKNGYERRETVPLWVDVLRWGYQWEHPITLRITCYGAPDFGPPVEVEAYRSESPRASAIKASANHAGIGRAVCGLALLLAGE